MPGGADAQIDWDYPGNLIGYYPEEDIVESAYGVGFETSSHLYPVAMTQSDERLTVSYVTLIWYPDAEGAHVAAATRCWTAAGRITDAGRADSTCR